MKSDHKFLIPLKNEKINLKSMTAYKKCFNYYDKVINFSVPRAEK